MLNEMVYIKSLVEILWLEEVSWLNVSKVASVVVLRYLFQDYETQISDMQIEFKIKLTWSSFKLLLMALILSELLWFVIMTLMFDLGVILKEEIICVL